MLGSVSIDKPPKEVLKLSEFAVLMREMPYRLPSNFCDWKNVASALALYSWAFQSKSERIEIPEDEDELPSRLVKLLSVRAPLYALSEDMLKQFQENDVNDLFRIIPEEWQPNLRIICLVFSRGSVFDRRGEEIVFCIAALSPGCIHDALSKRFLTVSALRGDIGISQFVANLSNVFENQSLLSEPVMLIALQAFLSLDYSKRLIEDSVPLSAVSGRGFQKAKVHDAPLERSPRWIGREFKQTRSMPKGGSHASPSSHWRRGHWRSQPCGKGSKDRRLIMIDPILVAGNSIAAPVD